MATTKQKSNTVRHPAYGSIREMLEHGLNFTVIAWHLNNRRPLITPPYGAAEWTAVLVKNVSDSVGK